MKVKPIKILFFYIQLLSVVLLLVISTTKSKGQISYQSLYSSTTFLKSIDQSKPIGVIDGVSEVDLQGSASYTISIPCPEGTNSMHPEISILYNSRTRNGIMGYGWGIGGLSAITRSAKTNFLDNKDAPVKYNNDDVFELDGNRLYPNSGVYGSNGSTYIKEQIDFSEIVSHNNFGNGPEYFTLKDKFGTTYEFGHTVDSKLLTDDLNHVMIWYLNKIQDVNGNFIEFIYEYSNRELRISQINYTGNSALGLAPYNKIKFEYVTGRMDANTIYEAGYSIKSNSLLKDISIYGEGNIAFKKYSFEYAHDNLYSYLQEIKEFGADNFASQLNSTIFKYGNQPAEFENTSVAINNLPTINTLDYLSTLDIDGDGRSEILVNETANSNNGQYVANISLFKLLNSSYSYIGNYQPSSSTTLKYEYNEKGEIPYGNLSNSNIFANADFNGDSKDDLLNIVVSTQNGATNLSEIKLVSFNKGTPYYNSIEYNIPLPNIDPFTEINLNKTFKCIGDFDGDGRTDCIIIASKFVNFNNNWVKRYKAYFYSAQNNYQPKEIHELQLPGTSLPSTEFTNIVEANTDDEINVINFDGDNKADLLVKISGTSYVFSILKNFSGDYTTEVISINTDLFNHRCFQGDFNGDGKTDLLSHEINNGWKLCTSNGKEFIVSSFAFNMADVELISWSNGQPHPKDNLLIGDFNGDGLSDILHGTSSINNTTNACTDPIYYIDVYYSNGNLFQLKNYSFTNNVLGCPNSSPPSDFPLNDFISSDINGDGRADLVYRTTSGNPIANIKFMKEGTERLLEGIKDGFNNATKFEYDLLTSGLPFHSAGAIANVSNSNLNVNYPQTKVQLPINMVKKHSIPDGVGGFNTTEFTYADAINQTSGRGFLGVTTSVSTNLLLNTKIVNSLMPNLAYSTFWLKSSEIFQLNTLLPISKVSYNNSFVSYGSKPFQQRVIDIVDHNIIQGYSKKISNNTFDIYGNVTNSKLEIFKGFGNNIEETESQISYVPVGTSLIPSVPSAVSNTFLRVGATSITTNTNFTYYGNGLLKDKTYFANLAYPITENYSYSGFGTINEIKTNASSLPPKVVAYQFDTKGRFPIKKTIKTIPLNTALTFEENYLVHPLWAKPISVISSDCQNTTYTYDAFGRLNSTKYKVGTAETYTVDQIRNWFNSPPYLTYENVVHPGRPDIFKFYDPLGRERATVTKGFNNSDIHSDVIYDVKGNISLRTNEYLLSETPISTIYQYDDFNRLISESNGLNTLTYQYTFVGGDYRKTITNSSTGQSRSALKDPTRKIIESTDNGGTLAFDYDSWGNLINVNKSGDEFFSRNYNEYNRLISETEINSGTKDFTYDALGQLATSTDALNNTYDYTYDAIGRLKSKIGAEGTITYGYGGTSLCQNSYLTNVTNFNGIQEEMQYDGFGNVTSHTTSIDPTHIYTHHYTYDKYDNNLTEEFPSGFKIYNDFTTDGYLQNVSYATAFNGPQPTAFHHIYSQQACNGMGQVKKYVLGNGCTSENSYSNGFLTKQRAYNNSNDVFNWEYTFNQANGNLLSRQDNLNLFKEEFSFDKLDRLNTSKITNLSTSSIAPIAQYRYDGILTSTLGSMVNNSLISGFNYSNTQIHGLVAAEVPLVNQNQAYVGYTTPDPLIISELDQDISYTPFNKTEKIVEDGREINFTYDAGYNRIKSVYTDIGSTNSVTKFYNGDYEEKVNLPGGATKLHYIYGGDGLCSIVTMDDVNGTQVHYLYKDHLGSIIKVTNESAMLVEAEQSFDSWGRKRNPQNWNAIYPSISTASNSPSWLYRGFTGHEHLQQFALINMNGRLYDPALGRMCSPDKYVQDRYFSQAYNRYSYCLNNPLKFTDPSGDLLISIIKGFSAGRASNNGFNWNNAWRATRNNLINGTVNPHGILSVLPGLHIYPEFVTGTKKDGFSINYAINTQVVDIKGSYNKLNRNHSSDGTDLNEETQSWTFHIAPLMRYSVTQYRNSGTTNQWVGAASIGPEFLSSVTISNDLFTPYKHDGWDKYRTGGAEFQAGLVKIGSSFYTGKPVSDEYDSNPNNGVYDNEFNESRIGTIYVGYENAKFGLNQENVRHRVQNLMIHTSTGTPYFPRLDEKYPNEKYYADYTLTPTLW